MDRISPEEIAQGIREASSSTTPKGYRPPEPYRCEICQDTGWMLAPNDPVRVTYCDCSVKARQQARIRAILQDWKEYREAKLETFKARNARQENALRVIKADPHGSYFLTGYYQLGKTRLMVAQYRKLAEAGDKNILLRTAYGLMDELRKAETAPEPGKEEFKSPVLEMVNAAETGHLFVDDVEKAAARSDFRAETLFAFLDTLKRRQIRLTLTSNLPLISRDLSKEDLRAKVTDQAVSRIAQICKLIDLGGG
jgi:DNA replication protein DnaC